MLLQQKESQKNDILMIILLFSLFLIYNIVLSFNEALYDFMLVVGLCIAPVILILMIVLPIIIKKNSGKIITVLGLLVMFVSFPIFIYDIQSRTGFAFYSVAIIASLIETVFCLFFVGGEKCDKSHIVLYKGCKTYFVYRRIDDESWLCGDKDRLRDATRVIMINIKDAMCDEKCYIRYVNDKPECKIKEKFKKKREADEIDN